MGAVTLSNRWPCIEEESKLRETNFLHFDILPVPSIGRTSQEVGSKNAVHAGQPFMEQMKVTGGSWN